MSKSKRINLNILLACLFMQGVSSKTIPQETMRIDSDFHSYHDTPRTLVDTVKSTVSTNASLPKGFKCANITYLGLVKPFEVCFTSTSVWEGNQNKTQHFHQNNFTIYDSKNHSKPLFQIGTSKKSDATTDGMVLSSAEWVQVFDVGQCKQKRYCGDDKYSADCTNIVFGRKVKCEPLFPLFFPFTEEAITSSKPLAMLFPTKASAAPSFRPTQTPTLKLDVTLSPTLFSRPVLTSVPSKIAGAITTPSPSAVPRTVVPVLPKSFPPTVPETTAPSRLPTLQPIMTRATTAPTATKSNVAPVTYATSAPQRQPSDSMNTSGPSYPQSRVRCINYTYPGMIGNPFEICYTDQVSYIDGVVSTLTNGTKAAVPCLKHMYNIYNGGNMTAPAFTIVLKRTGNHVPNDVDTSKFHVAKVAGVSRCRWAHYCGNNAFTADCTNILYGRRAICEPITPLFFPFTADAVRSTTDSNPIVKLSKPTHAPVSKPTRAPVPAPTVSYTTIADGTVLQCTNITYNGTTIPFKVCYKSKKVIQRSVKYLWNGIKPYVIERYDFNHTIFNQNRTKVIGIIGVGKSTNMYPNGTSSIRSVYVKVVGIAKCKSYSYCGQNKFSADCTNLLYGRNIICEPILPIFYPFTNEAISKGSKLKRILT